MSEGLTKRDLRGFDDDATKLILEAQAAGCRVKISRRNHAILYFGKGSTAVPRNLRTGNRAAQNARRSVSRLLEQKFE